MAVSGLVGAGRFYPANISLGSSDANGPAAPPLITTATAALTATFVGTAAKTIFASGAALSANVVLGTTVRRHATFHLRATVVLAATPAVTLAGTAKLSARVKLGAQVFTPRLGPLAPPVTLHGLSAQFLAAVATEHRWLLKVEVHTAAGDFIADITDNVVGGSVTVDETAKIRRTCQLAIVGDPSLIPPQVLSDDPLSKIDMLHPAKANELWIYRGVRYPGGTTEFAQLGVFRMSKPTVTDSGKEIAFVINGNDRSSVVSRLAWQKPFTINQTALNPQGAPGGSLGAAVFTVLNYLFTSEGTSTSMYPNLVYHLSESSFTFAGSTVPFTYPITTWGGDPSNPSDPMSDLATFVAAAGAELFFDVQGNVVLRPIINPETTVVVDAVHFKEGANCTVIDLARTIDETTAYNGVILYCNGTGSALPFVVKVWDLNQDSPTYYLGPWGQVAYRMTTTLIPAGSDSFTIAQQKGFYMAYQQLQLLLGSMDVLTIDTIPNPALQEGDCLFIERDRMQVSDPYVISRMTIPLDPQSQQQISFRPRIQAG